MYIDFNKIISGFEAPPVTLGYGDALYTIAPSIAAAATFDVARSPQPGETNAQQNARICAAMAAMFEGNAPPFLAEPMPTDRAEAFKYTSKMYALMGVMAAVIMEIAGPKAQVDAAISATRQQMSEPEPEPAEEEETTTTTPAAAPAATPTTADASSPTAAPATSGVAS